MQLLRRGKVKDVYEVDGDTLEFLFSDRISVFDKIIPNQVPFKGETLCRTSAFWFSIAEKMGMRTHFKGLPAGNRMKVLRLDILEGKPTTASKRYMIPLEFVARHYVAGSMHDRLKAGNIKASELGLGKKADYYGEKLPEPFIEVTTKFEKFDRPVDMREALSISGLTKDEFKAIRETILKMDETIGNEVRKRGLIHVDGKKEFGFDDRREILIVDSFGTTDEDRWWDLKSYEKGEFIERSKEFVRQYYRGIGYYEKLVKAREKGGKEPDIPALPDDKLKEVSALYIEMYQKITGEEFR